MVPRLTLNTWSHLSREVSGCLEPQTYITTPGLKVFGLVAAGFHIAQASLELCVANDEPELVIFLPLTPCASIAGMCHHAQFCSPGRTQDSMHSRQALYQQRYIPSKLVLFIMEIKHAP